jgi:DNA-binding MarR family transcriptional regulator
MKASNETVLAQLERVINQILFLKRKSLFQFQGVKFYPSEIHLMLMVKDKTATNATKMARQLGVTKGAVSQTLTRLEKKGVLSKTKDPFNKNELTLKFTPFGSQAFEYYGRRSAELGKNHENRLESFTEEEKEVIQRFLKGLEEVFEDIG